MVENRTKINDFFMSFYINGNDSIIFASGIPSYVTKHHPLVKFCKENKLNLFLPRYYGSLEAGGKFSLLNSAKAIEKAVEIVKKSKTKELFGKKEITWNSGKIYLFGYSFGTLPVLLANLDNSDVEVILNSPFVNLKLNEKNKGQTKDFSYTEEAYPNLFRFKTGELIKEYYGVDLPEPRKITVFLEVEIQ